MSRTLRAIIGILLILAITFSAIHVCGHLGARIKADITDQKIYTLSEGTRAILGKLNQPITAKLYFAKTASLKGLRFFSEVGVM